MSAMVEANSIELGADSSPPLLPSAVMGTLIFVYSEAMMFMGLISALTISKSSAPLWPPPGQARLPIEATAVNTLILLASGILLFFAARKFKQDPLQARTPFLASMLTGSFFVLFQGFEWVRLLGQGLTLTSSNHASFFYLIVGLHALHVVAGLTVLIAAFLRLRRGCLESSFLGATQVFWYFVVGLWPILYLKVYL